MQDSLSQHLLHELLNVIIFFIIIRCKILKLEEKTE